MRVEWYIFTDQSIFLSLWIYTYEYIHTRMYARVISRRGVIEQDENVEECILNSIHPHIVVPVSVSVHMIICIYLCVRV